MEKQNFIKKQEKKEEKEDFFIQENEKDVLRSLITKYLTVEGVLEQVNPKLRDLYLQRCSEEDHLENLAHPDPFLSMFKVKPEKMNNEEKMLYSFLCPVNLDSDIKDLLVYINDLYERLCTVNRKNLDYITGHHQEIYSFLLKEATEHYYAAKLRVYITDDDEEEYDTERTPLTEEETRERMEEIMQHPLFMTEAPKDIEGNVHLQALQTLKYEDTPDKIGSQCLKESKNAFLTYKTKKTFKDLKESMVSITNGIDHCQDDETVDISQRVDLLLQRAAINTHIKNYKHVVDDCHKAFSLVEQAKAHPDDDINASKITNITKILPFFVESLVALGNFKLAETTLASLKNSFFSQLEKKTLSLENYNLFLVKHSSLISLLQNKKEDHHKALEEQEVFRQLMNDEKEKLYEDLVSVGINIKQQYHKIPMNCVANIYKDEEGDFHFPVLIIYEEFNMTDYIQDITVETTVQDVVDMLFEQQLPWDKENLYTKLSLRVFYEMTTKDAGASTYTTTYYYPLLMKDRMYDVLRNPRIVMNGFPVISIVSSNSKFFDHFVKNKIILKRRNKNL